MNPDYLKIRKKVYQKKKKGRHPIRIALIGIALCVFLLPFAYVIKGGTVMPDPQQSPSGYGSAPSGEKEDSARPVMAYDPIATGDSSAADSESSSFSSSENRITPEKYFEDALFIGDSRTEGLAVYSHLPHTTFYAKKGLTVENIFTDAFIEEGEQKVTVLEALSQHHFSRIYVMLGINELGWQYSEIFSQQYEKLIEEIRTLQPSADLYIQSILPVSKEKSEEDPYINRERINQYNDLLQELAEKTEAEYVPLDQSLSTEEGYLPEEASVDGVHLNREYCEEWISSLQELLS